MEPIEKIHKKKTMLLSIVLCLAIAFVGCKKYLAIPAPQTQLVTGSVFANNITATSSQLYIYTQMQSNSESYNIASSMGLYADELANHSASQTQIELYENALLAANNPGPWVNAYAYIYDANAVIEGLQTTAGCSPAVKQQLTGEALFIRAFWHLYLTNIYGDVPLVLTPSFQTNVTIARSARKQVLQQVVADLEQSKNLLNSNYIDASDTTATTERARPNKSAALALLARAWLYLGDFDNSNASDYAKADSAATAVIGNSNYSLSPLGNVFLENSTEAIWQLETPTNASSDTRDGVDFILTGAPSTGTTKSTTINTPLMSAFETGDQRMINWIGSITAGTSTYYFPYKYKQRTYQNKEYTMVLRLGEQFLIRAEARVHEGNLTGAQVDLNVIRTRSGLPNTTAATQSDLFAAVLHERQVELFTEWGNRWFDLVRTGNAPAIMQIICPQKGGTWNGNNYQLLFPIPARDLLLDPNLVQNPQY